MLRLHKITNQRKIVCILNRFLWPVTFNNSYCMIYMIIFSVAKTCSSGADPYKNANDLTKTCKVASDCGGPAVCENQICCPTPIQEGKNQICCHTPMQEGKNQICCPTPKQEGKNQICCPTPIQKVRIRFAVLHLYKR
jgi:hypothetical protein